jgi:hypothetical protein
MVDETTTGGTELECVEALVDPSAGLARVRSHRP